jgi:hypothetical protein
MLALTTDIEEEELDYEEDEEAEDGDDDGPLPDDESHGVFNQDLDELEEQKRVASERREEAKRFKFNVTAPTFIPGQPPPPPPIVKKWIEPIYYGASIPNSSPTFLLLHSLGAWYWGHPATCKQFRFSSILIYLVPWDEDGLGNLWLGVGWVTSWVAQPICTCCPTHSITNTDFVVGYRMDNNKRCMVLQSTHD